MNNILRFIVISISFVSMDCFAFNETKTHPALTEMAYKVKSSVLGTYLINQLGFQSGHKTLFLKKNMLSWFQTGSTEEDIPSCRAANHFHNPLKPWDQSESSDVWPMDKFCQLKGWTPRYSNITWATGLESPTGPVLPRDLQDMGYDNAKIYFYNALTSTDTQTREALFAKSFRAVGQAIHLLQDMAVPAHVRNDFLSHMIFAGISISWPVNWFLNPFETYVKNNPKLLSVISEIPRYTITGATVSDFWDTDGRAGKPFSQGLAEYTNANYLSDFTIPGNMHIPYFSSHSFPAPQIPTYTCSDKIIGAFGKTRKYASRVPCPTDGGTVDHFAAISMFSPRLLGLPPIPLMYFNKYVLDDNVHFTYATASDGLLAKAVGYSAALLDYFFRGTIEVQPIVAKSTLRLIRVKAVNTTATGEEMPSGTVSLVIRYRIRSESQDHTINPPAENSPYYYRMASLAVPVDIPKGQGAEYLFDLGDDPLPLFATDVTLQLIYRGQLGNEAGAVAVGSAPFDKITGDIALSLPDSGVFATATPDATGFDRLSVNALTYADLARPDGVFELILKYRLSSDPFQNAEVTTQPDDPNAFRIIRATEANRVNTLQPGISKELVFDISTTPLPLWASNVFLDVVYRRAGISAEKPLAIGELDISETTPVDVYNNTDFTCLNNKWYRYDDPAAMAIVDLNNNGIADKADIYPHTISDITFQAGSADAGTLSASPQHNNLSAVGPLQPGQMLRLGYILTDYTNRFTFDEQWANISAQDDWSTDSSTTTFAGTAFTNQTGKVLGGMYTIRGSKMWWGTSVVYENYSYPEGSNCDADLLIQPVP